MKKILFDLFSIFLLVFIIGFNVILLSLIACVGGLVFVFDWLLNKFGHKK